MTDADSERHPLEVLAAEFAERYRRGERPALTEYVAGHPDLAEQIRALFPAVVQMEDLKRARLHGAGYPSAARARVPDRLGDCRIIREVGRGGMGIVYEAEQETLGRRVAVKVLTAQALLDPGQLRRFHREARAMARLHHTNIVPVFEVGEHDGLPYCVMEFIDGRGLDAVLREGGGQAGAIRHLTPGGVARVGLQVAEALAHAHAQGVLHRDVKPSNLLLDGRGTVWVTDFGVSRLAEPDDVTAPGEMAGTLRYMAPERFRGQSDPRGDVYSLGLTLYELLTRRPAFDESDRGRLVRQVTQEEPPALRRVDPTIPRDLETVILKAMARDPGHRYPSAGEVAEDLRRFLEDKPVQARRVGPGERLWRWCRRNPAVAGLTAVAAGLLVLVAASASAGYVQTRAALRREAALRQEAEDQRRSAEANLALARTAFAREAEQRREASSERERAEANLALALRAFDAIFAQATRRPASGPAGPGGDETEPTVPPVVTREVAALLHNLLQFYDDFGERNRSDPRLRREIARAHRRVGDIQQRLGQLDQAEVAYRRALALDEEPAAGPRGDADAVCEQAAVRNELGRVLQTTGRYADAEKEHRQALKTLRAQLTPAPGPAACRYELARAHSLLGGVLGKTGQLSEAAQHHRSALRLLTRLRADDPGNPDYRLAQARSNRDLSFVLSLQARLPEAGGAYRRAVVDLEQLAKDFPAVADYRYELGEVLIRSPGGGAAPWQERQAERQLRRGLNLARELAVGFPAVPDYLALRARAAHRLGTYLQAAGRASEADPLQREAVTLHRTLVKQFPAVPGYQMYRAEACGWFGLTLYQRGELAEARALLEEAVDAREAFLKATPPNRFGRLQLAHDYQVLAGTLRRLGEVERSDEAFRRAAAARRDS
jgi:tetratricopeptide (TPR) repeat protein